MNIEDRFKAKKEVIVFYIITILFTWGLWFPALLIKNHGVYFPISFDLLITVGTFVPSIAGFVFAYIYGGKSEVYLLFKSLFNIRIPLKWLFFAFLFLPGVSAISCLIFKLSGDTLPQIQFAPQFLPIVFVYILILMGPLGEEAGWRGFALKRMLQNLSPIKASVLIGVIWSLWHLPLFFINGTTQNALTSFGILPALLGYFLYTTIISILITLLYINSNGSVFGSILLHTMGNLSLGFIPLIFLKKGAVILLLSLLAATVIIVYKFRKAFFYNKKS